MVMWLFFFGRVEGKLEWIKVIGYIVLGKLSLNINEELYIRIGFIY